jgi:hypothetical protein
MRIAGASVVFSGSFPYFSARCTKAAGRPGMPADHGPFWARSRLKSPFSSRYSSGVDAAGAVSRASMKTSLPVFASCSRKKPPPPRPELIGSTTDSVDDTATAASNALPPSRRICSPASVARRWPEAIATPGGCVAARAAGCCAAIAGTKANSRRSVKLIDFMRIPVKQFL